MNPDSPVYERAITDGLTTIRYSVWNLDGDAFATIQIENDEGPLGCHTFTVRDTDVADALANMAVDMANAIDDVLEKKVVPFRRAVA